MFIVRMGRFDAFSACIGETQIGAVRLNALFYCNQLHYAVPAIAHYNVLFYSQSGTLFAYIRVSLEPFMG